MRLDDLLAELHTRLHGMLSTRDRVHALLEAVVSIGSDLDLETVLRRLTEAAATLVDARYAGLGVLHEDGGFAEFIPVGLSEEEISRIERRPTGSGLLGYLTKDREPLRMTDLSRHPRFSGFPAGHPEMRTFLGVPIRVRNEVFGNLYLTEKAGGGEFDKDDEAIVTSLATAAGVAIENARLYEESRLRERWLAASTEVSTQLLSGADTEDVLTLLAQRAREMADADLSLVLLPTDDERLLVEIADGVAAERMHGLTVSVEGTTLGAVYQGAAAMAAARLRPDDIPGCDDIGIGRGLFVPLGTRLRTLGVLALGKSTDRAAFTAATIRMLDAFSDQAAIALELAEAQRDAERLVVLEDRDRIAKDLHDTVIQRIFASAMTLMSTVKLVDDPEAKERIQRTIDDLDETIQEIRSTVFALQHPSGSQEAPLRTRIHDAVDAAAPSLRNRPVVRINGPIDASVPEDVGEHLLAVLREALSNTARHADAHTVSVSIDVGEQCRLTVVDDGVGIPEEGRRSGLRNLAERAASLGGHFTVAPGAEGGTHLSWTVPLSR